MRGTNARERIIRAYAQLMREKGSDNLTVREVYETAGVSKMSFYYHFSTLDEVQEALFGLFLSRLDESDVIGSNVVGGDGDIDLLKRGIIEMYQVFFDEQELFSALMLGPTRWRLCDQLITWFRERSSRYSLYVQGDLGPEKLPRDARGIYLYGVSWQIVGWLSYLVDESFDLTLEEFADFTLQAASVDGRLSRPR